VVRQAENDANASVVFQAHWPSVPNIRDISDVD
jgi:hypothetical protein